MQALTLSLVLNRVLPVEYVRVVTDYLLSLLQCKFERLPQETLVHIYQFLYRWQQVQKMPYFQCLVAHNVSKQACKEQSVMAYCGPRFGLVSI